MTSLLAMLKREYLEHRGAFFYSPLLVLALVLLVIISGLASNRLEMQAELGIISSLTLFELGFLGAGLMWFAYLMVTLFFYYADAFSADRRNNAMLFWKSMPLSDFEVLGSKMLAGLLLFPALIFIAFLATGVLILLGIVAASAMLPGLIAASPADYLGAAVQVVLFQLVYVFLATLWYAPFFAWVGMLSTAFGRWAIPLALLAPALLGLAEKLLFNIGGSMFGYIADYLGWRLQFGLEEEAVFVNLVSGTRFDAMEMLGQLFASIDFAQLTGGLAVAALFVYAGSEYRRRSNAT